MPAAATEQARGIARPDHRDGGGIDALNGIRDGGGTMAAGHPRHFELIHVALSSLKTPMYREVGFPGAGRSRTILIIRIREASWGEVRKWAALSDPAPVPRLPSVRFSSTAALPAREGSHAASAGGGIHASALSGGWFSSGS